MGSGNGLKLITIFWMLVILVGEAAGQRILSAECTLAALSRLECLRDAGAVPGSANSLFADGLSRFPMAPESALQTFESGCELQARVLQGYSATTRISAELPDMSRRGEFEVRRIYVAPETLEFTPLRFYHYNYLPAAASPVVVVGQTLAEVGSAASSLH